MKRRIISILAVCCMMVAMMPAAFAAGTDAHVTSLDELNSALDDAGITTIYLDNDISLGATTLTIDRGVTIDGTAAKNALNYTGTSTSNYAIDVSTNEPVVLNNLELNATNANGRGVGLVGTSTKFTFSNSEMNVGNRGIGVVNSCDTNSYITISNSVIKNSQLPAGRTYDDWALCRDARGISLWDMNNATVTIENSEILGFGYTVNLAGTLVDGTRNYNGTEIVVTNSKLKGWTAFNVWSSETIFKITGSDLLGVNTWSTGANDFATIVVNDDIYKNGWGGADANEFHFNGGTVSTAKSGTNEEELFRIDDGGVTKVLFTNIRNKTEFIDGTGDSESVFFSGYGMDDPTDWNDFIENRVTNEDTAATTIGYNNTQLPWIPAGNM